MAHPASTSPQGTGPDPRVVELERRIEALEAEGDSAFGSFTRSDWWICTVGAVALPIAALWWFAG